VWFEVPEPESDGLSKTGNPWLLALMPVAVHLGESLRLPLPVDPELLLGAEEIMRAWAKWFPGLRPSPIDAEILRPTSHAQPAGRTALFFTGGVDSFFSLLHAEAPGRRPLPGERPVEDLVYVWGYDIPLSDRASFDRKQAQLGSLAHRLGKRLVTLATNLRETRLGDLDWGARAHGAALGAAGLMLEGRWSEVRISSSNSYENARPWGSSPFTDAFMSTTATRLVHHGAGFDRFDKLEFLAGSDAAIESLHVCWQTGTDRNCGRCEKCLRTLLALEILGVRHRAATFDAPALDLRLVRRLRYGRAAAPHNLRRLIRAARERGRRDIVRAGEAAFARDRRLRRIETALDRVGRGVAGRSIARRLKRWLNRHTVS
jgi:hypothetical protein